MVESVQALDGVTGERLQAIQRTLIDGGDDALKALLESIANLNRQITSAVLSRDISQAGSCMGQLARRIMVLRHFKNKRSLEVLFHVLADATLASSTGDAAADEILAIRAPTVAYGIVQARRLREAAAEAIVAIGTLARAYITQFPPDPRAPVRLSLSAVVERLNPSRPPEHEAEQVVQLPRTNPLRAVWNRFQLWQVERNVRTLIRRRASGVAVVTVTEDALRLAHQCFGEYSEQTAKWLHTLGREYRESGDPRAESCLRRALAVSRRVFGSFDPRTTVVLSNLGGICRILGQVDEAESYYREALAIDTLVSGTRHQETLTDIATWLSFNSAGMT